MSMSAKQIEAYELVAELERRNRSLVSSNRNFRVSNERLRDDIKLLNSRLEHAIMQLARRRPEILSQEEWDAILMMRGVCR